jgi:hypothetical protein
MSLHGPDKERIKMVARKWLASLALMLSGGAAQAIPVEVTFTFSDVTWNHEGFTNSVGFGQVISGDWVFKSTFDNEAPAVIAGDIRRTYALTGPVTLTQASLGLVDATILNLHYLSFFLERASFGFSSDHSIWPRLGANLPQIYPNINPFENGYGPVTSAVGGISSHDEGFLFADGSRLFGYGNALSTTIGAAVAPVPEPETWLAMIAGLGVLVGRFAKRREASAQPAMQAA